VKDPQVSAVIPAYNAERYLAEALESVLAQTSRPTEILVVDDGSTDGTAQIVERFGSKVQLIHQSHAGAAVARNRAIAAASGGWIAFLDADDIWMPAKTERQLRSIEASPEAAIVFGRVEEFVSPEIPPHTKTSLERFTTPVKGTIPSAMMVRRDVFDRVGTFDQSYRLVDFAEWLMRCRAVGVVELEAPDVVARRRIHGGNLGMMKKEFQSEYALALKRYLTRTRRPT
jgi:glycosyltransferase involved in cell wall biosynthesis